MEPLRYTTTVSRLIQECPILETGSLAAFLGTWMVLAVPSEPPFDATPPVHCSLGCLHDVQCFCFRQQAQEKVQIRAVCCVTWSHRILPDLNVLRARCSHQLTQSWCHRCTVCFHFERPCCPSFLTIMLARIHVWFRQEFCAQQGLSQLALRSVPLQFAVRSTLVPQPQVVPLATLPVLSAVGFL